MDNKDLFKEIKEEDGSILARCIVRVKTSDWSDSRGVYLKKSVTFLKKLSFEYSILKEDVENFGSEIINKITNLDESKDGIYEVVVCNERHDYETGYVEDYDYKLIPYKKEENV